MQLDPEYLTQHYASLSDEGLFEIDRADLVEAAQRCYDQEVAKRNPRAREEDAEQEDAPDWLDEAAEVYSSYIRPGVTGAPDAEDARDALKAAGIPCYLDVYDEPPTENAAPAPTRRWRLTVPGQLNLRATSVLDRDIFNHEFEEGWRTHLEMLSDDDLATANPEQVFCGLFDRIERATRAYNEELARRGLPPATEAL